MHLRKYLNVSWNTDVSLFNRCFTVICNTYSDIWKQKLHLFQSFECVKNTLLYYSRVTTSKQLFEQILI